MMEENISKGKESTPQTEQEEEEAGVNQKIEKENKNEGEESTEKKSEDEDDKIKGEDGEKVEDSANSEEKQMEGSAIEDQAISLTSSATSDSETSSLVETWTLVEKDEAEHETTEEPIDEGGKNFDDIKAPVETDSESIETISEDEAQSFPTLPLASFCYVSGPGSSSRGMSSQVSTLSSFSMASDGIPIRAGDDIDGDEDDEELQYEWSTEGEREIE